MGNDPVALACESQCGCLAEAIGCTGNEDCFRHSLFLVKGGQDMFGQLIEHALNRFGTEAQIQRDMINANLLKLPEVLDKSVMTRPKS